MKVEMGRGGHVSGASLGLDAASLLVSTVLLDRAEEAGLADLEVASAENMDLVYEALITEALTTAAISIRVTNAIYVTSNVLADAIFIFRCFAIWNFRWSVIIIPTFFTIAVAALGYSASLSSIVFLFVGSIGTSFFTTVMLMGLSAGRIWWLARKARQVLGKKMISRYYTVCAMILESGALYCAGAMAFIILFVNFWTMDGSYVGDIAFSTGALLGQLVGIAPTIIAVRVGIGKSVESADSFVEMAQPRAWACEILAAIGSPVSIQQRFLGLRRESGNDSVKADMPLPLSLPPVLFLMALAGPLKIEDIENSMYIAMAEVFLYGVYAVMFGFYVHVLSTQGMGKNRALPVATILLFILCTAHLGLLLASTVFYNHALTSKPTLKHGREPDPVLQATNAIYVTSNLVADSIFFGEARAVGQIFRCYAIWNFRWRVIIIPIFSTVLVADELTSFRQ
ncbi:hypothetical protein K438DRAFT_1986738 [Mycena galopus ATCC 62051]|nr:hypothetical protein K438DRAFT_1986738 [Mycena galopus ATCC 62051]